MYLVTMIIYDNGKHDISLPTPTDRTASTMKSCSSCDIYYDVFDTYERAYKFYKANKEEIDRC